MRVCLIYCAVGVAGFNANRPSGDREGSWIGHGAASVGACAKTAGYEVELIDMRHLSGWDEFGERLEANPAQVYGLSVAPVDHYTALKAIFEIKTRIPAAKIIIGGIHPSIMPQQYDFQVVDTVVVGEGEVTFVDLLRTIERGETLPRQVRGVKPDLDKIPWVDRELFDYRREMECIFAPDQQTPSVTMLAGRGCQYSCNYCQPAENAVFGKPYRMRSPENILAELKVLHDEYAFKSITFWDDTFTFNRKWIMAFCDLYQEAGFTQSIAACSRADIICNNEDMVKRLAEIGVDWLVIGLESGSQRLLDLIQKGTTVAQNREAVTICRKYGIKVFGTFMFGLPTETRQESQATADLIREIAPALASPFWFTPIPGTGLFDYCQKHELILDGVLDRGIERTGCFLPTLKGIDYDYLKTLMGSLQRQG
jgi:anaerobic magnesium-protoporphyrin IX monomethyl ester cyclase